MVSISCFSSFSVLLNLSFCISSCELRREIVPLYSYDFLVIRLLEVKVILVI